MSRSVSEDYGTLTDSFKPFDGALVIKGTIDATDNIVRAETDLNDRIASVKDRIEKHDFDAHGHEKSVFKILDGLISDIDILDVDGT